MQIPYQFLIWESQSGGNSFSVQWYYLLVRRGKESMEFDNHDESNGGTIEVKENGFHLFPVSVGESGEGFPYAPVDWPNPGDRWSWRAGNRVAASGYFLDRYLYFPSHLQRSTCKKRVFASKLAVQQYIQAKFPSADVDAFFASFSWKIPAKNLSGTGSEEEIRIAPAPSEEIAEHSDSDSQFGAVSCKAGNEICSSLVEARDSTLVAMCCDVCCSEPGFCQDCCCILCCKTTDLAYEGYGFIKCEAMVDEGLICGHIAHIDCALRANMAGTVGGSLGLDSEYYCRRCDARTDLVSHVKKLLQTCKTTDSQEDIGKILTVGSRVLHGSQKTSAKSLLHHIELAMEKLKCGAHPVDIWKIGDFSAATAGGLSNHGCDALGVTNYQERLAFETGSPRSLSANFDLQDESRKLENEIAKVLQAMREAQESEYEIARERLSEQKNHLLNLYRLLDKERSEPSLQTSPNEQDVVVEAVLDRVNDIKQETLKLRNMEVVAKGFAKTSKDILREHFGLDTDH